MALVVASCGGESSDAPEAGGEVIRWDYLIENQFAHPVGVESLKFADDVLEATDGRLELTVRAPGELGVEITEYLTALSRGDAELVNAVNLRTAGIAPNLAVTSLTGIAYGSRDSLERAIEALEPFYEPELRELGGQAITHHTQAPLKVMGSGEVPDGMDGLAGRTIRTIDQSQEALIEALGARPTTIDSQEVGTALSQGLLDALTTAATTAISLGWSEDLDWIFESGQLTGTSYTVVQIEALDALPTDVRDAFLEVASEFGPRLTQVLAEEEDKAIAEMEEAGIELVPTEDGDQERIESLSTPYSLSWAERSGGTVPDALAVVIETARGS